MATGTSKRVFFEVRDSGVYRVCEKQIARGGFYTRTHDRKVADNIEDFEELYPGSMNRIRGMPQPDTTPEPRDLTAESVLESLSADERARLRELVAAEQNAEGGNGDGDEVPGSRPLPDDLPARQLLIDAGFDSVARLRTVNDLTEIDGVGEKTAERILERLAEL